MPKASKKIIPYGIKKLGVYLKQLREESELSLHQAAREAEISPSYLLKIEAGTFSNIGIRNLIKLSKVYNIPIGALLQEAGLAESDEYGFPDFPQYLRAKYHLSPQAIRDLEMAKEIVEKKYKNLPH